MTKLRVAIVGSGASAFATLLTLQELAQDHALNLDLSLFEWGTEPATAPSLEWAETDQRALRNYYSQLYVKIKKEVGLKFPPIKTHLGDGLTQWSIEGKKRFIKSRHFGGLTNFWGATLLPFSERDLSGFPWTRSELDPFYLTLTKHVGIAGRPDRLSEFYGGEFANRPAIHLGRGVERLINAVSTEQHAQYQFWSGVNRVAVDTDSKSARACIACGECMAGCAKDSIWSSKGGVKQFLQILEGKLISGRVWKVDLTKRRIEVRDDKLSAPTDHGPFDRIFLCAGALHTAEILMRSANITSGPRLVDNSVFQFPIINIGAASSYSEGGKYVALTNAIIAARNRGAPELDAQIQIYPNFDYLWRLAVPEAIWKMLGTLVKATRDRVLWGRAYLHSNFCNEYELSLDSANEELSFSVCNRPDLSTARPLINDFAKSLRGSKFLVPTSKAIIAKTSSHLAGTFPVGNKFLQVQPTGEVGDGVSICDSAIFPYSPATSLTFSIMAHASRAVVSSLGLDIRAGARQQR